MKGVSPLTGILLIVIFSIALAAGILLYLQFMLKPLIPVIPRGIPTFPSPPLKEKLPILREENVTLPTENIINYRLTQRQEDHAISRGKTILTLDYDANCKPCVEYMKFLEKIATQEKDQIIFKKLLDTSQIQPG